MEARALKTLVYVKSTRQNDIDMNPTEYIAPTKTGARELLLEMLAALKSDDPQAYWAAYEKLQIMHAALKETNVTQ